MKKKITALNGPAVIVLLIVLSGCNLKENKPAGSNNPVRVRLETVTVTSDKGSYSYVGIIEEKSSTAISFSALGTIERIFVREGQLVSRGQLLARLDTTSAGSLLDAADATLKQAQDAFDRLTSVHEKGSLTEVQMVDIRTRLQQAKSSYNIAGNNLQNCFLYAPVSGVIGRKMAEAGEFSVAGKAILTILDISSVRVRVSVPENEISAIPANCKSVITVSALGNRVMKGGTAEKSVEANSISHTYPVFINLPNSARELLPGMVCTVEINSESDWHGIVVPLGIVQTTAKGLKYVWRDDNGVAKRAFVTTGAARGNGIEITDGLTSGDRIVTEGYQKISENDKITGE